MMENKTEEGFILRLRRSSPRRRRLGRRRRRLLLLRVLHFLHPCHVSSSACFVFSRGLGQNLDFK